VWTTVVLLGLAISIEPARVGAIAFLLTKQRPVCQLLGFVCTGLTISLTVGFVVLFVFHHSFLSSGNVNPAVIQIGIGIVAVLLGALLASKIKLPKGSRQPMVDVPNRGTPDGVAGPQDPPPTGLKKLVHRFGQFLKGESSLLSGSLGATLAMPSVDYFALLALIIASKAPPLEQAAAVLTFLLLGGLVAWMPLLSFLLAPARTRIWVQHFNNWIRTRTRKHVGAFLAVLGFILIGIGLHGL
jgi:hypothetical protein